MKGKPCLLVSLLVLVSSVSPLLAADLDSLCTTALREQNTSKIAQSLLGQKYKANTLESKPNELVLDWSGFDCLTFVETVYALELSAQSGLCTEQAYSHWLRNLRYRDPANTSYLGRLHYLTEWLLSAQSRGFLRPLTGSHCGNQPLNFLSSRASSDPSKQKFFQQTEAGLIELCYFTAGEEFPAMLAPGDLIAFRSGREGLDFNHVALVAEVKADRRIFFYHASSLNGRIERNVEDLSTYLKKSRLDLGVVFAKKLF